jgi:3-hydroxy-9,10-secoandrosta-1,3,5(10)-triene-9,17-dione monooxygenase reductase component
MTLARTPEPALVDPAGGVAPEQFRSVLAHAPSAVAVVTGMGPDGPVGLAVGSFVSVSLDPPLIGFFPARTSTSWPTVRAAGVFCVNLLAEDQTDLSAKFAVRGGDKFDGVAWTSSVAGTPVLDGCLVWIQCILEREVETGDHTLVLGRVLELTVARDAHALVFHRGAYTSTAPVTVRRV